MENNYEWTPEQLHQVAKAIVKHYESPNSSYLELYESMLERVAYLEAEYGLVFEEALKQALLTR